MFWYQPDIEDKPYTWECWTEDPRPQGIEVQLGHCEHIGYIDIMYTTLEKNKLLASFCMNNHPEQEESIAYFFDLDEAKNHIESEYMAWKMIGTLDVSTL